MTAFADIIAFITGAVWWDVCFYTGLRVQYSDNIKIKKNKHKRWNFGSECLDKGSHCNPHNGLSAKRRKTPCFYNKL